MQQPKSPSPLRSGKSLQQRGRPLAHGFARALRSRLSRSHGLSPHPAPPLRRRRASLAAASAAASAEKLTAEKLTAALPNSPSSPTDPTDPTDPTAQREGLAPDDRARLLPPPPGPAPAPRRPALALALAPTTIDRGGQRTSNKVLHHRCRALLLLRERAGAAARPLCAAARLPTRLPAHCAHSRAHAPAQLPLLRPKCSRKLGVLHTCPPGLAHRRRCSPSIPDS